MKTTGTLSILNFIQWDRVNISEHTWAMIMMAVAMFITVLMVLARKNIFYGLIILWSFYGIIIKRMQADASLSLNVINFGVAGIIISGLSCLLQLIRNFSSKNNTFYFNP